MNKEDLDRLISRLPAQPGILGRKDSFNAAVIVPLFEREDEYHLLFQKRASHIRQGGEICFPGGLFEPDKDKSARDTALRETGEELGLSPDKIEIVGQLDAQVTFSPGVIDAFLALLDIRSPEETQPDPQEVAEVFSLPLSFFAQNPAQEYDLLLTLSPHIIDEQGKRQVLFPTEELDLPEYYHDSWHRKVKVYAYPSPHGTIWGITARFIRDIMQKIHS